MTYCTKPYVRDKQKKSKLEKKINSSVFKIEQLNQELYDSAILFLENVFYKEQNIPKELIPLTE